MGHVEKKLYPENTPKHFYRYLD